MDKEGILSLPNPCAEKVFFLKSRKHKLKEELAGQAKERKESVCTWTSETSRVSSSQDGQESISDDEDEDEDDDISASVDDSGSVGKIYYSPAGSTVTKDQVAFKRKPLETTDKKVQFRFHLYTGGNHEVCLIFLMLLFFSWILEDNWNSSFKGHREVLNLSSDPEVCLKKAKEMCIS